MKRQILYKRQIFYKIIVRAPSPLGGGESQQLKKGVQVWCRAGLLKRGVGLALFLLNFLKVHLFYIQKVVYPSQNCVMHLKKDYCFVPP